MTNIDKFIKLNLSMVKGEICTVAGTSFAAVLCTIPLGQIFIALVLMCVSIGFLFKAYEKLYYTTMYGEGTLMYRALPISEEEMTAAKVFCGFAVSVAWQCAIVLGMTVGVILLDFGLNTGHSAYVIAEIMEMLPPARNIALIMFLSMTTSSFYRAAIFFLMVTWYNCRSRVQRNGAAKAGIVAAYIAFSYLGQKFGETIEENFAVGSFIVVLILGSVLNIVIGAVACKLSVKTLKSRYCAE